MSEWIARRDKKSGQVEHKAIVIITDQFAVSEIGNTKE